ncbi:uncharacterized protein LOC120438562 [Oreochromis aureus]|uniref:Immunoglobulin domain-containing protein n=1 Tax=Oreochromis aureus TaxID=47969 RepID=A0AAZ1XIV8_OREAU|nr:uncharacterized protein LOC120438562 [Oreochromis aureus]
MKTASVSQLLGVCVLLLSALTVSAVSLTVSPNLQQFFTGASVSLTCEGQLGSDGWTVKRDTGSGTESCGAGGRGFGRTNGSSCLFDKQTKPVSGVYWCEGEAGEKSEEVNITVSGKEVILEIPALPVRTGSDVTLRCKKKTGGTAAAYFYCNGRPLRPKSEKNITINVQQSDEGLYWCATDEFGSSPQSFLRVRDVYDTTTISASATKPPLPTTTTTITNLNSPTSSSSIITPALGSLGLLDLILVAALVFWNKKIERTLSSSLSQVTYQEMIFRQSANKITVTHSNVVFSSLRILQVHQG